MKAWAVAAAALSLTALCACSSTEDEKAPENSAAVEDQWKYHVKKSYPQWQAPAETPAPATVPAAQVQTKSETYAEPPGFIVKDNFGTFTAPKTELPKTEGFSHYTVKKGDSLWSISKMVYHRADKWNKIYDVNKDVIKDPSRLKPGTDLKIPPP